MVQMPSVQCMIHYGTNNIRRSPHGRNISMIVWRYLTTPLTATFFFFFYCTSYEVNEHSEHPMARGAHQLPVESSRPHSSGVGIHGLMVVCRGRGIKDVIARVLVHFLASRNDGNRKKILSTMMMPTINYDYYYAFAS